jgi:hypothetical protein
MPDNLNPNMPDNKYGRYFEYLPGKAKCFTCQKEVPRKDAASYHMKKHLKTSHRKLFQKYSEAISSNVEGNAELYNNLDMEKPANKMQRYFEYLYNPERAKCRICQKVLSRKNTKTECMRKHLKGCHKQLFEEYSEEVKKVEKKRKRGALANPGVLSTIQLGKKIYA